MTLNIKDILLEPLFTPQLINIGEYPESHNEHVRETARKLQGVERQLFCEMLELCKSGDDFSWYEEARWIKFEETVEGTKERWSKPHVPLLSLKGLLQLRNCLNRGLVLLDLNANTFPQLVAKIVKCWEEEKAITMESTEIISALLLSNKEHVTSKRHLLRNLHNTFSSSSRRVSADISGIMSQIENDLHHSNGNSPYDEGRIEIEDKTRNTELSKKLSETAEVACILIGQTEYVNSSISAFVRLSEPRSFSNCAEVNRKLRFLFVLLAPEDLDDEMEMIGRTLGASLTDEVFINVAYEAETPTELCYALDEIMSSSLIIPPGKWSIDSRLEPQDNARMLTRRSAKFNGFSPKKLGLRRSIHEFHADGLQYTGKIFGGLREDVMRKLPYWVSDFTSPFVSPNAFSQCLAASLYLFFANFTNIITFGGIMGKMLDQEMGVIECVVSGAISGLLFGTFSGQPLNIMSATGPVLIFETIFYHFCLSQDWAFLPARFWLGFWTSVFLLVLVAFDASILVAFITRFTEECFATLISVIFIFESFQAMNKLASNAPITTDLSVLEDPCRCTVYTMNGTNFTWIVNDTKENDCKASNGNLTGAMCNFFPNVFVFSLLLFLCTFALAYTFHTFRSSRFFPSKVRAFVGDFNVFITILIMTMWSYYVGIPVETLNTPTDFKPSRNRSWLVDVTDVVDWWLILACILPGIFLTVLIVMDQQITAVIVNRKENKLKKGFGYHLDLLIVAVLIAICSLFGLPYFVAATILSITHVESLRIQSETAAPGETARFLGVREQRVTALLAHLLIAASIFSASIQKHIPIAVLLGIFLYMGVTSMLTQQFVERILLFFTPVKYQPDYSFLRIVPLKRVFIFTAIQLGAFMLLYVVKNMKDISMIFPILLVVLVGLRKGLDKIFSQNELMALDDILPDFRTLVKSKFSVSSQASRHSNVKQRLTVTSADNVSKKQDKLLSSS